MFGQHPEQVALMEKWPSMTYEEKVDVFLRKMSWYHSVINVPGSPTQAIESLTLELNKSSQSSENLTKSIRNATWVAAVIGALGLILTAINLFQ